MFFSLFRNPVSAAKSSYNFYLGGSKIFNTEAFTWERYESLFMANFQAQFFLTPALFNMNPLEAKWKADPNFVPIKPSNINPIYDIMQTLDVV
eukprot:CAMPEP_0196592936 /NCGR_PEP_ID=MMETSP1081-20130531/74228_1 /TAXON_ID=36882 /ORGANISM="Pyramimonas amylifera, Strain CCMP720" /LENGTH=92 /DNA_ID=CAMNT_0041916763 /DNA_START=32 /DNA_END=306 /DNA_ORIENTATION=-